MYKRLEKIEKRSLKRITIYTEKCRNEKKIIIKKLNKKSGKKYS